jgi:hypothetical protein
VTTGTIVDPGCVESRFDATFPANQSEGRRIALVYKRAMKASVSFDNREDPVWLRLADRHRTRTLEGVRKLSEESVRFRFQARFRRIERAPVGTVFTVSRAAC